MSEVSGQIRRSLAALIGSPRMGEMTTLGLIHGIPVTGNGYHLPFNPSQVVFHDGGEKMLHEFVTEKKVSVGFENRFRGFAHGAPHMIVDTGLSLPESIFIVARTELEYVPEYSRWLGHMARPKLMIAPSRANGIVFLAFTFAGFFR